MKRAWKYLRYLLRSSSRFGVHAPFMYKLIHEVLRDNRQFYAFEEVEELRQELKADQDELHASDQGAGSYVMGRKRTIGQFVKHASIRPKHGRLLFRLINYFQPSTILELGTGAGLGTAYMALARHRASIISLEENETLCDISEQVFEALDLTNVEVRQGTFVNQLATAVERLGTIDFVLIDGDHRFEPTLQNFQKCLAASHQQTVFVVDDVHWSDEMEQAWEAIKRDPQVTLTVDLFEMGIVFFRKELSKEHYEIRY